MLAVVMWLAKKVAQEFVPGNEGRHQFLYVAYVAYVPSQSQHVKNELSGSLITKYRIYRQSPHWPREPRSLPDENQPQWEVDPIQAKPLKRRDPAREFVFL